MTLTKDKLADTIRDTCGVTKKDSHTLVDELLGIMKNTLVNGEDVLISGFGKFSVKKKGGRRGRNPVTGETLMLDQRRVVRFKYSGALRDKINRSE